MVNSCAHHTQIHTPPSSYPITRLGRVLDVISSVTASSSPPMTSSPVSSGGSGLRKYENLTLAQKKRLAEKLECQLSTQHVGQKKSWMSDMNELVQSVLKRRAAYGQPLDASTVAMEVMPIARTRIPHAVRSQLFRDIIEMMPDD